MDILLSVPQYYLQTDSRTAHADRMCFSSTCAMALKYLKPDALKGSNADDTYLRTVLKFGDTISSVAQVKALKEYGVTATFKTNGNVGKLRDLLSKGVPVPVGFLHKGSSASPTGGGHWILVIGLTNSHIIAHDPYGELDNYRGGYPRPGVGGKEVTYSLWNWLPRWEVDGPNTGWYLELEPTAPPVLPPPIKIESWAQARKVAADLGAKWPQLVAAQWALESGFGKKVTGKNNYFGIKGPSGSDVVTSEFINGAWKQIVATFKDYETPQEAFNDLIRLWYKDYKSYKGINNAKTIEEAAHMIVKEGYATDPLYANKLLVLIKQHDR